jgi:hypothetical protein
VHKPGLVPQTQMTSHVPSASREEFAGIADPDEVDYEALPTTSLRTQLLAGAIAGIAEHTIVYPIDAIKVSPSPQHRQSLEMEGY